MNAAVFGSNGFLGRNLISGLLEKKFEVWAFYKTNQDQIPAACTKVPIAEIAEIDVEFDYLFISIGNHSLSKELFEAQFEFLNFVLQNVKFKKVIYVSSVAVYGNHSDVIKENSGFNQPSVYGTTKVSEEQLIVQQNQFSIIRFTYLYGTGMDDNSMIPKLCKQAKSNKVISVYGGGSRCQDYLEVTDAVSLLIKAALQNENILLIGASGKSISNKEVAMEIAANISGTSIEYIDVDKSPSFFYDINKAKTELLWQPEITFNEGIKKMIKNDLANL